MAQCHLICFTVSPGFPQYPQNRYNCRRRRHSLQWFGYEFLLPAASTTHPSYGAFATKTCEASPWPPNSSQIIFLNSNRQFPPHNVNVFVWFSVVQIRKNALHISTIRTIEPTFAYETFGKMKGRKLIFLMWPDHYLPSHLVSCSFSSCRSSAKGLRRNNAPEYVGTTGWKSDIPPTGNRQRGQQRTDESTCVNYVGTRSRKARAQFGRITAWDFRSNPISTFRYSALQHAVTGFYVSSSWLHPYCPHVCWQR